MNVVGPLMAAVVVLPALAALVISVHSRGRPDRYWLLSTVTLSVTAVFTAVLGALLVVEGATMYRLSPGVTFSLDILSATVAVLDVVLKLGVLTYTRTGGPHSRRFYASFLFFGTALFGIVFSGDLLLTGVSFVVLIAATAHLVSSSEKVGANRAARNYLRTAALGAAVYLAGVLVAARVGGATDYVLLGESLAAIGYAETAVVVAFILVTVGLALLAALFPLHGWLIETHARAADPVSALISGVLPATAVYVLARVLFDVFTLDFFAANPAITSGMRYGVLAGLLLGNLLAYGQRDIKGVLAYSTVSQFGLIISGLLVASETAIFGSVIQLFGHGIVKGALCLAAGIIAIRFDARTRDEYGGLADRAPVVAAAFAGLGIALVGLPPTVGFVGKWYIAVGAFAEGLWVISAFVVISTVLSLGYMIPFLDQIYFGTFSGTDHGQHAVTLPMVGAIVVAVVVAFGIGLASVALESVLREAIEGLV